MSLVGSLEDLGLADILQIVSLARKSGRLLLRSDDGEGWIALQDGLVRGAAVKGQREGLRALLVGGGHVEAEAFDRAARSAGDAATSCPSTGQIAEPPRTPRKGAWHSEGCSGGARPRRRGLAEPNGARLFQHGRRRACREILR